MARAVRPGLPTAAGTNLPGLRLDWLRPARSISVHARRLAKCVAAYPPAPPSCQYLRVGWILPVIRLERLDLLGLEIEAQPSNVRAREWDITWE